MMGLTGIRILHVIKNPVSSRVLYLTTTSGDRSSRLNTPGYCYKDVGLLVIAFRRGPHNIRIQQRRGKGITGQNNIIGC